MFTMSELLNISCLNSISISHFHWTILYIVPLYSPKSSTIIILLHLALNLVQNGFKNLYESTNDAITVVIEHAHWCLIDQYGQLYNTIQYNTIQDNTTQHNTRCMAQFYSWDFNRFLLIFISIYVRYCEQLKANYDTPSWYVCWYSQKLAQFAVSIFT